MQLIPVGLGMATQKQHIHTGLYRTLIYIYTANSAKAIKKYVNCCLLSGHGFKSVTSDDREI